MNKKWGFLDIDGCLNTQHYIGNADFHSVIYDGRSLIKEKLNFNESSVRLVKELQQKWNLTVVISSSWRFGVEPKHFIEMFKLFDWNLNEVYLCDQSMVEKFDTPAVYRSDIIQKFVDEHNISDTDFIIIDDTYSLFNSLFTNLITANRIYGFTEENYYQADALIRHLDILGKEFDEDSN